MNRICSFLITILIGYSCHAQEKFDVGNYNIETSPAKRYHVKIILINGQHVKGIIELVGDYTVKLKQAVYKKNANPGDSASRNEISYGRIKSIKIRNVWASIGGTVVGTVGGVAVGGLFGFVECTSCHTVDDHFGTAFLGAIIGGGLGGVIGCMIGPPTFEVEGRYDNFIEFEKWIEKRRNR